AGGRTVQRRRRPDDGLARLHVGDQRNGHPGVRTAGPLLEHPQPAAVQRQPGHRYRVRRTKPRLALRHAGWKAVSPRNQAHRRPPLGTDQTAAAGVVSSVMHWRDARSTEPRRHERDPRRYEDSRRTQTTSLTSQLLFVIFVFLRALAVPSAQDPAKTVADGVYTDAQASRGATAYEAACAGCHRADLGGGTGPALQEKRFAQQFADKDLRT